MTIPIASCLSQLKWNHFQHRPNSLYHLQIYDDASRGPWGCFYMISTGHLRAISAWALALLTLAALGFEPSIQQTIEPLTRQTLLRNAVILNGAVGSVQDPNFSCPEPAVECTWDQFDTLAVCADYTNSTNTVTWECGVWDGEKYCTFIFPEGDSVIFPDPQLLEWEAFTITLNWCTRTYHTVTALPAGFQTRNYTSTPLFYPNISSTGLLGYAIGLVPSDLPLYNSVDDTDCGTDLDFGLFIYHTDLRKFTSNLEETLTNQIRSSSPGDNQDAEMWPGRAFYQETYWCAHWPWVIVPIAEVVITIILLGITIMFSQNQPLFKSSSLALLVHPLGRYKDNRVLHGIQDNSVGKLEDLAKGMRVEFKEDKEGILKFLPVEDRKCSE
ncbi:hypothetical protein GGR58DRAFT_528092 [Xylaria digitata]|nr:hypothetical protein GGR58DRAFT_528092 [Xylaria digitata]